MGIASLTMKSGLRLGAWYVQACLVCMFKLCMSRRSSLLLDCVSLTTHSLYILLILSWDLGFFAAASSWSVWR